MNNTPLDEIRKALDAATPGPWKWIGDGVCLFPQNGVDYGDYIMFVQKSAEPKEADAHLIANSPAWLRSLIEENERLTREIESHGPEGRNYTNLQYVNLLQELERVKRDWSASGGVIQTGLDKIERLESELEQVKKERDKALAYPTEWAYEQACKALEKNRADVNSLRSELAAKDKVLEWYGGGSEDGGEKARSILSQYARSAIVPNE